MVGTFLGNYTYERLRGAAFVFLSDTGHIVQGSVSDDQGGGGTTTWTVDSTDIPCRVDTMGGGEGALAARISDLSTHLLAVPAGTDLDIRDRFAVNGGTFEVTANLDHTGDVIRNYEIAAV